MINNIIKLGAIDCTYLLISDDVQTFVSELLLVICMCMVPLMLFVKPLYLNSKYKKEAKVLMNKSHDKLREEHENFDSL